jgi:hypothetical protein
LDEKPAGTGFLLSPNCRITLPQMSRQPGVVCEDKFLLYKLHPVDKRGFFDGCGGRIRTNDLRVMSSIWDTAAHLIAPEKFLFRMKFNISPYFSLHFV